MSLELRPNLIYRSPDSIRSIYASQPWVNEKDIPTAYEHNSGRGHYKSDPTVYTFRVGRKHGIIVGDGHHRVADAIIRDMQLRLEVDIDFGLLDPELLRNPSKAAQKFAIYGIEGIWPFSSFLEKFVQKQAELSARNRRLNPGNLLQNS